jgi:hypothetical protein
MLFESEMRRYMLIQLCALILLQKCKARENRYDTSNKTPYVYLAEKLLNILDPLYSLLFITHHT